MAENSKDGPKNDTPELDSPHDESKYSFEEQFEFLSELVSKGIFET